MDSTAIEEQGVFSSISASIIRLSHILFYFSGQISGMNMKEQEWKWEVGEG